MKPDEKNYNRCEATEMPVSASGLFVKLALIATVALTQSSCLSKLSPQQAETEEARLQSSLSIFRTGCIDEAPGFSGSIRTFDRAGLSQKAEPQANVAGVHTPDLGLGAFVSRISVPGYNLSECTLVIDAISLPTAAATWYALSQSYFGTGPKRGPSGIKSGGQLPRYRPDGRFESLYFDTGRNIETGSPAFSLILAVGRTTLPLGELTNGQLAPTTVASIGPAARGASR